MSTLAFRLNTLAQRSSGSTTYPRTAQRRGRDVANEKTRQNTAALTGHAKLHVGQASAPQGHGIDRCQDSHDQREPQLRERARHLACKQTHTTVLVSVHRTDALCSAWLVKFGKRPSLWGKSLSPDMFRNSGDKTEPTELNGETGHHEHEYCTHSVVER